MSLSEEEEIKKWALKRMLKQIESERGDGTSLITLIIPSGGQISQYSQKLTDEQGTASNIKSRVNKLSVLSAITSVQYSLKRYKRTPPNGLVILCGEVMQASGKTKKVNYNIEPIKPINTSKYKCDSKFHIESLMDLLQDDEAFGIIVIDGKCALFATVQGSHVKIIHKFTVDLPKKHGRGGQSAARFGRIRVEKRALYIKKVSEEATNIFITDNLINVRGLILAGSAELKADLGKADVFDMRLKCKILKLVDVSYGGASGLHQAINLASDVMGNVKLYKEKEVISSFFDEIAQDTNKVCYALKDTMSALEAGAVQNLIIWEDLATIRHVVRNTDGTEEIIYSEGRAAAPAELDIVSSDVLVEWLAEHYKSFGTTINLVTDRSQEGSQFVMGFGGIGGTLRYAIDRSLYADDDDDIDLDEYEDYM